MATFFWSDEQEAIFSWFNRRPEVEQAVREHLVVTARAGTGKTTTIIEAATRAPEAKILLCAFNNRIADELKKKATDTRVTVKTLHGIGYGIVRKFWEGLKLDDSRADLLTNEVCGAKAPDTIKRLVSQLHTKGREIAPHARRLGDLADLMVQFSLVPDEQWAMTSYDETYVEEKALEAMELAASVKPRIIDFSDMLFLPVRNGWVSPEYDLVIVDEAQDMTVTQLALAKGVARGRICVVGDDRQAIYGFRGADSESLGRLQRELGAASLGLKTTYRCGRAIVEEARRYVPDFEAGECNPAGEILGSTTSKLVVEAGPGDFILSRTNAPLISVAMTLLRAGKRTQVAGKDIGAGLKALVRKLKGDSVPSTLARITAWEEKEIHRLERGRKQAAESRQKTFEAKMDLVRDQASMLISLADGAKNVAEITDRIDGLFTDNGLGAAGVITCSSVHRAKGLEADRVFILAETLRKGDIEEDNIAYVAITRAKKTLVWVGKD